MRLKKLLVLLVVTFLLCGCQTDSSKPSDQKENKTPTAKEVYEEVLDAMNNLSFVKIQTETTYANNDRRFINESYNYMIDGCHNYIVKSMINDSVDSYSIRNGKSLAIVSGYEDDSTVVEVNDGYVANEETMFSSIYNGKNIDIISDSKEEKDGKTVITIKYSDKDEMRNEYDEEGNIIESGKTLTYYNLMEVTINSDGYIESETVKLYSDSKYETLLDGGFVTTKTMSDYNKKSIKSDDLSNIIKELDTLNGKPFNEVSQKIDELIKPYL